MGKNRARFISQVEDCLKGCGLSMAGREGGMGKRMDGRAASLLLLLQDENLTTCPAGGFPLPWSSAALQESSFSELNWQSVTIQVFVFLAFPASCGWVLGFPGSL